MGPSRTRKVLRFRSRVERVVQYGRPEDDFATHLTVADWEDLGRPDEITVTVEPGDQLNNEARLDSEAIALAKVWQDAVDGK